MQDRADPTRFVGGAAMSLTRCASGTRATVSDAGRIDHTPRPIMLGASFLRRERCPLTTTQSAIRLWENVLSPQTSSSCRTRPLWGRDQMVLPGMGLLMEVWGDRTFSQSRMALCVDRK